jgi:hypothetical protein
MGRENRRKGPDTIIKVITLLSLCTWLALILVFVLQSFSPEGGGTLYAIKHGRGTNQSIPTLIRIVLFINLAVSLGALILDKTRTKRKSDHIHLSLIVSSALCIIALTLMYM